MGLFSVDFDHGIEFLIFKNIGFDNKIYMKWISTTLGI